MSGETLTVYVITATHPSMAADALGDRPRVELGKFFKKEDADAHAKLVHRSWVKVQIDSRQERVDEQHQAHRMDPPKKPPTYVK